MSATDAASPRLASEDRLALACCLCWLGSTFLSRLIGLWLAVGAVAILLGVLVLWKGGTEPGEWSFSRVRLAAGLAAGGLMTALTSLLFPPAQALLPEVVAQSSSLYATFGQSVGWRSLLVLPLVIAGEEIVWRGAVQQSLTRHFGPMRGVLLMTAAYALAVAPVGSTLLIGIATACGLYWGLLKMWTRNMWAVLAAHFLWDLFVFVLIPLTRLPR